MTPTATSTCSGSAASTRTTASAGSLSGRDVSELERQPVGRRRLALAGAQPAHVDAVHVELGSVAATSSAVATESLTKSTSTVTCIW